MKSKLILFYSIFICALFSNAQPSSDMVQVFTYQAYEDSDFSEKFPFEIYVEASADFSKINKILIKEIKHNILFFELNETQFKTIKADGVFKIQDTVQDLKPLNLKAYSNYYGDTDISQEYTYAIYLEFYKNDQGQFKVC